MAAGRGHIELGPVLLLLVDFLSCFLAFCVVVVCCVCLVGLLLFSWELSLLVSWHDSHCISAGLKFRLLSVIGLGPSPWNWELGMDPKACCSSGMAWSSIKGVE